MIDNEEELEKIEYSIRREPPDQEWLLQNQVLVPFNYSLDDLIKFIETKYGVELAVA